MILKTSWTILLIFFTVFLIYCNVTISVFKPQNFPASKEYDIPVQKIVAYSLVKQIELEGRELFCDRKIFENISLAENAGRKFWKKVEHSQVYFLSGTFDRRLEPYYYIRIVGVIKGSLNNTLYCQILMNDGHVRVIKPTVMSIWYKKWNLNDNNTYYNPTLISCRLPVLEDYISPQALALSTTPCKPPVKFHRLSKPANQQKRNFTICVKPLNFKEDVSAHLVQWIEICRLLGAEYFFLFLGNVTNGTRTILEWYKTEFPNLIHLEEFKPVDDNYTSQKRSLLQKTWQRRRYEIVAYNSCFYKNLNSKYVIPLDIDELIVPKTADRWQDIVQDLDNYSSLIVQNVYFFTRGRKQANPPFFLKENTRTEAISGKGENGKSFILTKNALTVFNHYALDLLKPGVIKDYFLPFSAVQLNHYKEFCNPVIFPDCSKYLSSLRIVDTIMFKFKAKFNERYRDVLNKIRKYGIKI